MPFYTKPRRAVPLTIDEKILALAPRRLTLLDIRRRVGGKGTQTMRLMFGGTLSVSGLFGAALHDLVFNGQIYLDRERGKLRVVPGRAYRRVA